MLNISGHLRSQRRISGYRDDVQPLVINCCGEQIFRTRDYAQDRSCGRVDYQLIYLYKGVGHYLLDGKWQALSSGNLLLFCPGEPQVYAYRAKEQPEVYWIHFTGADVEDVLHHYGIQSGYIGESMEIKNLYQTVILELQLKKPLFEDLVRSNFLTMLGLMARLSKRSLLPAENDFSLDRLLISLNQRYMEDWNTGRMAAVCGMSESRFAHAFCKRLGTPPMRYLNSLRMEKAKDLLSMHEESISQAAAMVGFSDPLYFSRVFKKYTGSSPSAYRRELLKGYTPSWWPQDV